MLSQRQFRFLADALALLFAVLLLWFVAGKLVAVRTPEHGDQSSYLELALHLATGEGFVAKNLSPFYPTKEITHPESIRQPLLPLLLSLSAGQDLSFFLRARWWVWSLSAICLLVIYINVMRIWGRRAAFLTTALLGLNTHFQTFASEVWCENLLILWTTAAGLSIHEYFRSEHWQPSYRLLTVAGLAVGLGYYTKASAAALLVAFAGLCAVRLLRAVRKREPSDRIYKWSIAPLLRFLLPFLLLLLPYIILNLASTGEPFRNRDLGAAPWIGQRGEYFLPHKSPPSASLLLQQEPWSYFAHRLGIGLLLQIPNHVDALRVTPPTLDALAVSTRLGTVYFVPLVILAVALVHLLRYPIRGWRGFMLLLLSFNLLLAAWYVVIDVAPRFILVGVPFLYLHAALGFQAFIEWTLRRVASRKGVRILIGNLSYILPFLLLAATLWQGRSLLRMRPSPLYANEMTMIFYLKDQTDQEAVVMMGPSHRLPWNYIFDRRYIFVPNYRKWDRLTEYADYFRAQYFLLDQELYHRRKELFSPYVGWDDRQGIYLKHPLPGMEPIYVDPGFMLFRVLPLTARQAVGPNESGG